MKISFISQYFFPEPFSNNLIAKDLVSRGHEVVATVCVPNYPAGKFIEGYSNSRKRDENWNGVHINRVRTMARGSRAITLIGNYLSYILFGSLRMLLKPGKPDVIFVSQLSPITILIPAIVQRWRTGAPIVCWVQDIWPESAIYNLQINNKFLIKCANIFSGWLYRRADHILIQSPAFGPMIERFGVDSKKISVFPNTAPKGFEPRVKSEIKEQHLFGSAKEFKIVFAGNIGESQGLENAVAAAKLLKGKVKIRWIIIGEGRFLATLKQLVLDEGVGDSFSFLGRYPEERMPEFFALADALLVSLKDTQIFSLTVPYKVQAYMACGKPIIAVLAGEGAKTVLDAKAGVVAKPDSPDELAEEVEGLLKMTKRAREILGQNGRRFYLKNFDSKVVYDGLENCLIKIKETKIK